MFKIFASLQNRMEGRVLLQIWIFCFYMAPYVHTCSLARWLSHMGAPLLDYFPPSDGNLSPWKRFLPPVSRPLCFALNFAREISPQKVHFRSSFRLCANCDNHVVVHSHRLAKNVELWFHMNYVELPQFLALNTEFKFVFRAKIVFNKDMSFNLKVVILHIYSLVVWN